MSIAVVLAVALAACGNSQNTSNSGAGSPAADDSSGSSLSGTPVKIDVLCNCGGGAYAAFESYIPVTVKAWVDDTNKNGGIGGHPVKLSVLNTKADASVATGLTNQVVADKSVDVVMLDDDVTESVIAPILDKANIPMIGFGYTPTVWGQVGKPGLSHVYNTAITYPLLQYVDAVVAKQDGGTKWTTVVCGESPSCLGAVSIFKSDVEKAGLSYGGTIQTLASTPDYTAPCLQMIGDKTDVIGVQVDPAVAGRVSKACVAQGYKGWFNITVATALKSVIEKLPNVDGGITGFPWWMSSDPIGAKFQQVMKSGNVPDEYWQNSNGTTTYAALELFKKVLVDDKLITPSTTVTADMVNANYRKVKGNPLPGILAGPVDYTQGGTSVTQPCAWMYSQKQPGVLTGSMTPYCVPASAQ